VSQAGFGLRLFEKESIHQEQPWAEMGGGEMSLRSVWGRKWDSYTFISFFGRTNIS
jgi:proline dehydrogenase